MAEQTFSSAPSSTTDSVRQQLKKRFFACLGHLGIGLAILLPLLYLIRFVWYPNIYFSTDGGWTGVFIIFCVDMVLGPALTFIIFDPRKKRSKIVFDLCVIAAVQLGALAWGVNAVYSQRPAAVVYWEGQFRSVVPDAFARQGVSVSQLVQTSEQSPALLHARAFDSKDDLAKSFERTMNEGLEPYHQFDRLQPLVPYMDQIRAEQMTLADLEAEVGTAIEPHLQELALEVDVPAESITVVPFKGRYRHAVIFLNQQGQLLDGLDVGEPRLF